MCTIVAGGCAYQVEEDVIEVRKILEGGAQIVDLTAAEGQAATDLDWYGNPHPSASGGAPPYSRRVKTKTVRVDVGQVTAVY